VKRSRPQALEPLVLFKKMKREKKGAPAKKEDSEVPSTFDTKGFNNPITVRLDQENTAMKKNTLRMRGQRGVATS